MGTGNAASSVTRFYAVSGSVELGGACIASGCRFDYLHMADKPPSGLGNALHYGHPVIERDIE